LPLGGHSNRGEQRWQESHWGHSEMLRFEIAKISFSRFPFMYAQLLPVWFRILHHAHLCSFLMDRSANPQPSHLARSVVRFNPSFAAASCGHRPRSRPAQAYTLSELDRSLPRSSMTGKFGRNADGESRALFAFVPWVWEHSVPQKDHRGFHQIL